MNNVDFNISIKLKDIESLKSKEVFQHWLQRVRDYYISPAQEMDKHQNGFASLILQLCAIDALASFVSSDKTVEQKIRSFCQQMIHRSQEFQIEEGRKRGRNVEPDLKEEDIEKATQHLYFQYRCGLVHNGFTLQVGDYSRKNDLNHIFLISYETHSPISMMNVGEKNAFVVNPLKFRTMLQFEINFLQGVTSEMKEEVSKKLLDSLKVEIAIAKLLG